MISALTQELINLDDVNDVNATLLGPSKAASPPRWEAKREETVKR